MPALPDCTPSALIADDVFRHHEFGHGLPANCGEVEKVPARAKPGERVVRLSNLLLLALVAVAQPDVFHHVPGGFLRPQPGVGNGGTTLPYLGDVRWSGTAFIARRSSRKGENHEQKRHAERVKSCPSRLDCLCLRDGWQAHLFKNFHIAQIVLGESGGKRSPGSGSGILPLAVRCLGWRMRPGLR